MEKGFQPKTLAYFFPTAWLALLKIFLFPPDLPDLQKKKNQKYFQPDSHTSLIVEVFEALK